jgi:hypothetical protein
MALDVLGNAIGETVAWYCLIYRTGDTVMKGTDLGSDCYFGMDLAYF